MAGEVQPDAGDVVAVAAGVVEPGVAEELPQPPGDVLWVAGGQDGLDVEQRALLAPVGAGTQVAVGAGGNEEVAFGPVFDEHGGGDAGREAGEHAAGVRAGGEVDELAGEGGGDVGEQVVDGDVVARPQGRDGVGGGTGSVGGSR